MHGRAKHEWIFVDGGRDGRSVDVTRRRTRRLAVIDRYFVIHHALALETANFYPATRMHSAD